MIVLPTRTDTPFYDFEIELDGRSFILTFRWNDRDTAWFVDIATDSGDSILSGRKLVLEAPILRRFFDPRLPPGELALLDTTDKDQEAGASELGARVLLLYVPVAELNEFLEAA